MQITNADGSAPLSTARSLKLRLVDTFRKPGQSSMDIMGEIKLLTDKDLEDFRGWFIEVGLPVQ